MDQETRRSKVPYKTQPCIEFEEYLSQKPEFKSEETMHTYYLSYDSLE